MALCNSVKTFVPFVVKKRLRITTKFTENENTENLREFLDYGSVYLCESFVTFVVKKSTHPTQQHPIIQHHLTGFRFINDHLHRTLCFREGIAQGNILYPTAVDGKIAPIAQYGYLVVVPGSIKLKSHHLPAKMDAGNGLVYQRPLGRAIRFKLKDQEQRHSNHQQHVKAGCGVFVWVG